MAEQKRDLALSEVLRQLEETHRRLLDYLHSVPDEHLTRKTPFRYRLRLDTYQPLPLARQGDTTVAGDDRSSREGVSLLSTSAGMREHFEPNKLFGRRKEHGQNGSVHVGLAEQSPGQQRSHSKASPRVKNERMARIPLQILRG